MTTAIATADFDTDSFTVLATISTGSLDTRRIGVAFTPAGWVALRAEEYTDIDEDLGDDITGVEYFTESEPGDYMRAVVAARELIRSSTDEAPERSRPKRKE